MAGEGGAITVGAVAVDIVPSAKNFLAKLLREIGPDVAKLGKIAAEAIEKQIADGVADGVEDGLQEGRRGAKTEGAKTGAEFAAGFIAATKAGLKAAEKALGDFNVKGDIEFDGLEDLLRDIAVAKEAVARLGRVKVGVDMDAGEFFAEAAAVRAVVASLRERAVKIGLDPSGLDSALRSMDGISEGFDRTERSAGRAKSEVTGFAAELQRIAQRASDAITIRAGLDSDPVYREAAKIKEVLDHIVARIGIDFDDAEAYVRMALLERRLRQLTEHRSIHIGVDREVLNASGVMEKIADGADRAAESAQGAATSMGGLAEKIGAVTPAAAVANGAVVGMFFALPAIIAVVNTAILGTIGLLTALGAMAGVALLGIGVAVLAFTKIAEAVSEVEDKQKKAAQTAAQAAQTAFNNQVALASANQAVAKAETQLARARTAGQKSVTQAARTLTGAERNLKIANEKETDARKKLSEAYKDAKDDLKKLNAEIRTNAAEQKKAAATVIQSREAYNAMLADPTASASDIIAAQADYNKAESDLGKLQAEQAKNQTEKARYDKVGLEANSGVISAQAALKTAIESVTDATDAQKTAAENSAQAQIDATNSVNDAEEALAQARTNRANTLKSQTLAAAVTTASQSEDTSTFDKLTETGKQFVKFYEDNIKPVIDSFFAAAQDSGILSGLVGFFDAMRPAMAPLKGLIGIVGHQMGVFMIQIGNFLASDEGLAFIDFLGNMVEQLEPVMASLAKSGLSIIFTLFEALAPVVEQLAPVIADLAQQFAAMFAEFVKSDDFKVIIDQLVKNAPMLLTAIVQIAYALLRLMVGIAPFTDQIIALIIKALEFFNSIPLDTIISITMFLAKLGAVLFAVTSFAALLAIAIAALVVKIASWLIGLVVKWAGGWEAIRDTINRNWEAVKLILRLGIAYVVSIWHGFTGVLGDAWDWVWSHLRGAVTGFFDWARLTFQRGVQMIGQIWTGIKSVFAVPLVAVITMINEGIIDPFNTVAGWFGGDGVDRLTAPKWAQEGVQRVANTFATGGIVGRGVQSSKRDDVVSTLRRGEGVLVPEVVQQLGVATILEWNRRGNLGQRIGGYATGGIATAEPKSHFTGGEAKAPGGLAGVAYNVIKDILDPLADTFSDKFGDNKLVNLLVTVPFKLLSLAATWLVDKAGDVGGAVVEGAKDAGRFVKDLLPFARGGIAPHWYDTGGYLPPGLTLAYNGTGRNERVMTHEQEQQMLRERAMRGGVDVNVKVHDGKVTGLISAEVDRQFGSLADDFIYGGV